MEKSQDILGKSLKFIFLAIITVISLGPFLWVFLSSFKTNKEILSFSFGLPEVFSLKNYVNAFKLAPIARFFFNSIFVTFMGVVLNVMAVSMSAYMLSRFEFKGRVLIRTIFSMGLLMPGAALLLPLYMSIKTIGLYNNVWGLVIVYAAFGIASSVFIMSSYFKTIPKEMEESAYLDGAGFIGTFVKIIIPLARPALATAGIMQFLLCWNEFQFSLVLTTGPESRTLPVALYYFKSAFASDYGAMFAAITLVSLPSIITYIFMQKQVASGLTAGSVKG